MAAFGVALQPTGHFFWSITRGLEVVHRGIYASTMAAVDGVAESRDICILMDERGAQFGALASLMVGLASVFR